ncbi:putative cysteine desulfurase, partial [Chlamydia psittaci 06-1683]
MMKRSFLLGELQQ